MLTAIETSRFFSGTIPRCIPSDAKTPEIDRITARSRMEKKDRSDDEILKKILEREHARLGAGNVALSAIKTIGTDTAFIVTGQQAGLFGGPLYTIYKAMHAVRLSMRLTELTGVSHIPLFWIASDDHDFAEVKHLGVRSDDGAEQSIEYSPAELREGLPVGEIFIDTGINEVLNKIESQMPPGDRSDYYNDILRKAWKPGMRWSDAFTIQMLRFFEQYGLVVFDPRWDGVKALFHNIFHSEIENPHASVDLVNEEAEKTERTHGRKTALRKPVGSTNLFLEVEGIRYPLRFDNNKFSAGHHIFYREQLYDLLDSSPDLFSPATALRPVCQDALFHTEAYIAGPGERLYLEQIKPIYNLFGVENAVIWPRASFTVVDPRTIRTAQKEHTELHTLFKNIKQIESEVARRQFPDNVENNIVHLEQSLIEGFDELAGSIGSIDPTLIDSVKKDRGRSLHIIEQIRERALRAYKASTHISYSRLGAASYFLNPVGGAQERWFGFDALFPFLGNAGFDELLLLTSPEEEMHRIIMVS